MINKNLNKPSLVQAKIVPNGKRNSFPMTISKGDKLVFGMTKLEYMAAMIAAGIASREHNTEYYVAGIAINTAKEILSQLEKDK
jgi:hypothetical protein